MGYESRVYIVDVSQHISPNGNVWTYADHIARFDMAVMGSMRDGYHFKDIFKMPVDFTFYDGDEMLTEDKYGDPLKYCGLPKLLAALKEMYEDDHYRRLPPLIGFIEGINPDDWDSLIAIHYGY